jgi:hypothetical protein
MLEPLAFAASVDAYLDSRSPEEIRALVLRSIKRLDGAHRGQLALFLGLDIAADPIDEVGGSPVNDERLRQFIESCGLLRERFGAFLRDNPRAIYALGKQASERILGHSENRFVTFLGRAPLKVAGLLVVIVIFAVVPLVAQYAHQRGMLAGLTDISIPPLIAPPPVMQAHITRKAPPRVASNAFASSRATIPVRHVAFRRAAPIKRRAVHHVQVRHLAVRQRPRISHRVHARHTKVARAWKFDPRYNPYFNHSRWRVVRTAAAMPASAPERRAPPVVLRSGFEGRAQLAVNSYLNAVISGNTPDALRHLGLSANASPSNVTESPIVSRDARAKVVAVDMQPDGRARVEAEINGRLGEYFETFYVARDGPAVRIVDRYYIPVNRTAEERAAQLLAKDGH